MRIIILLFIVLFSLCCQTTLIIPDARKDEIYTNSLNRITDKYELTKLRESYFSGDDFEVRVWFTGFQIEGFILRRFNNNWLAIAIKEVDCTKFRYYPKDKIYKLGKINLSTPKSGWKNTWQNLVESGIIDLPNSNEVSTIDGNSYVVETNQNGNYRIYFYSNPELQKTEEAKRMMKIGEIIADEFGLHNFKVGSLCLGK